jgi:outer membrane lipoprotein-sorting protein
MRHQRGIRACVILFLFFTSLWAGTRLAAQTEPDSLITRMVAAYGKVRDYQTFTVVRNFESGEQAEVQKFLYSFRKPKQMRLDFETPHNGLVLVYPDKQGKVLVKFSGIARLLPLHLSPDNPRLMSGTQRVDQSDMGLLIYKITHSLTDERVGKLSITEDQKFVDVRVLALNHFVPSTTTFYRFRIDKTLWLPVAVDESTPDGVPQRTVAFENLRINTGISDQFIKGG